MLNTIKSLNEALQFLYKNGLDTSEFIYRGQNNVDWGLQPSVYRYKNLLRYQTVVFENLLLQSKPYIPMSPLTVTNHDLEWLMTCQHYGIPTRLLDWSKDPLVGLFFACYDSQIKDKDGALFVAKKADYEQILKFSDFNEIQTQRDKGEIVFFESNTPNPRMRSQSGCFMLWDSYPLDKSVSTESYDLFEYQKRRPEAFFVKKIIIPSKYKKLILNQLKNNYQIDEEILLQNNKPISLHFAPRFQKLKANILIKTLWMTDAESLKGNEYFKALVLTGEGNMRDSFKNCDNLSSLILGRKPI
ncbi:FRG domain-containing protein [Winogradskyella maritima]|uniref:FRG domain-containing protein n=1 Tax=Winogradskyella maritima TaxID=1517766 RepID=A0ABV8AH18_9FLAO|nr:FRG domain-containing protein [Winogradskyella maritima]